MVVVREQTQLLDLTQAVMESYGALQAGFLGRPLEGPPLGPALHRHFTQAGR